MYVIHSFKLKLSCTILMYVYIYKEIYNYYGKFLEIQSHNTMYITYVVICS